MTPKYIDTIFFILTLIMVSALFYIVADPKVIQFVIPR